MVKGLRHCDHSMSQHIHMLHARKMYSSLLLLLSSRYKSNQVTQTYHQNSVFLCEGLQSIANLAMLGEARIHLHSTFWFLCQTFCMLLFQNLLTFENNPRRCGLKTMGKFFQRHEQLSFYTLWHFPKSSKCVSVDGNVCCYDILHQCSNLGWKTQNMRSNSFPRSGFGSRYSLKIDFLAQGWSNIWCFPCGSEW